MTMDFVNSGVLEFWIEPDDFRMDSQVFKHQIWMQWLTELSFDVEFQHVNI
jgi:hypothetical protein